MARGTLGLALVVLAAVFAVGVSAGGLTSFDPDNEPVVLIPGIAGTMIRFVDMTNNRKDELLWVRMTYLSYWMTEAFFGEFDKKTGFYTSLNNDKYQIYIPESGSGLYAIDSLNPDVPFQLASYWNAFTSHFLDIGYSAGHTLFGFPYDWRQSTRNSNTMKRLKKTIETAYAASGNKKVTLVAHSMGGLVSLSFLSLNKEFAEKYVKKLITLATPWHGAPGKTALAMTEGYTFSVPDIVLDKLTCQRVASTLPAMYELMADPDFKWAEDAYISATIQDEDYKWSVKEHAKFFKEVNQHATITTKAGDISTQFNDDAWNWSMDTRKLWRTSTMPKGMTFFNAPSCCINTPHSIEFEPNYESVSDILDSHYHDVIDSQLGDGTVAYESAKVPYWQPTEQIEITGDHMALVKEQATFDVVKKWISYGSHHETIWAQVSTDVKVLYRVTMHRVKKGDVTTIAAATGAFISVMALVIVAAVAIRRRQPAARPLSTRQEGYVMI